MRMNGGGGRRVQEVHTSAPFQYSPSCTLEFLNQFSRNALKKQFNKAKESIKTTYQKHSLEVFQR